MRKRRFPTPLHIAILLLLLVFCFFAMYSSSPAPPPPAPPPVEDNPLKQTLESMRAERDNLVTEMEAWKRLCSTPPQPAPSSLPPPPTVEPPPPPPITRHIGGSSNAQCEAQYGFGLIDRWQATSSPYCTGTTTITCRSLDQRGPVVFCDGQNVVVDYDRIHGAKGGEDIKDVWGQQEGVEFFKFDKGAFSGECQMDAQRPPFQHNQKDIWASFTTAPIPQSCEVVETPTLFITRYEYANNYHITTDFVNAYVAAQLASVDLSLLQIVILDGHPVAPMDAVWSTVFSPGRGALHAGAMKGSKCYKHALFGIPGYNSIIAHDWQKPNPCFRSDLLIAYSRAFLSAYPSLNTLSPKSLTITFCFRGDYVAHPRDSNGGKRRNKIANEAEVIDALKSRVGASAVVQGFDFAKLSYEEQIGLARQSDVLVGMHGGGLTHLLYLPDEAVVVEMFPNYIHPFKEHYRNLARWAGKTYLRWHSPSSDFEPNQWETRVDLSTFLPVMDAAIRMARNFQTRNGACGMSC